MRLAAVPSVAVLPFVAVLPLLAACHDPAKDVGGDPLDQVALADSEPLAWIGDALADGGPTTAGDLILTDTPEWASAPNPDGFFQARYAEHQALPALDGTPRTLKVLTYNCGLLSRHYAIFAKVAVPDIDARRAKQPEVLFQAGYDVLFLQEVWEIDDLDAFVKAGEDAGYVVWGGDGKKFHRETGVIIAVKQDLIGGDETRDQGQYAAQWKAENFPGPNLRRGWIERSFPLADRGVTVHLFDTHPTAFASNWRVRDLQMRELGLRIAQEPADDLVIVGGDLNAGWYYASDVWTNGDGEEEAEWWDNPLAAALLMHYGGLYDAKNAASPNQDVALGDEVPLDGGASYLEEPFGDASLCDAEPTTFTATDCNSLYFQNYAGTEYPARLDHLMYRDGTGNLRVTDQKLVFTDPMDFGADGSFELSDHYGVEVTLALGG